MNAACRLFTLVFGAVALAMMPAPASGTFSSPGAKTGAQGQGQSNAALTTLRQEIDDYISQPRFSSAHWGISVTSLDSGKTLYQHAAKRLSVPASNTKLYTAALALATLGPDYRVDTSLYTTNEPENGTIDGDLVLYGRGDPTLGNGDDSHAPTHWAGRLAKSLADRGVEHVTGDLIADATHFANPATPAGWEGRDLQSWFAPPISALSVRSNLFTLQIQPTNGLCCDIDLTPAMPHLDVVNLAGTDPDAGYGDLGLYRQGGDNKLYLYGDVRPHAKARYIALSAPDPARMAGNQLLEALTRHDIDVSGNVRTRHWPQKDSLAGNSSLTQLARVRSPRTGAVVHHALKNSDNMYAQLLFMQAGHYVKTHAGCDRPRHPHITSDWSRCAMRDLLRTVGIKRKQADIEEGSGLSRKDLVSPRATTRLLTWVTRQPFASTYRQALPIAGKDGTLQWRMRKTAAANNIHAKTGTLRHSYTLSGYVTSASGRKLVFSLMLDHYAGPSRPAPQHDLDAIATMLAEYNG